jgi:hypothetical protein
LLRMGWRNFFSSCAVVSVFWFWREIGFGVTYVLRVQYRCGIVLVFWFWREIVFGVSYVLRVQYSCAVVSVFWLWREIVLKNENTFRFPMSSFYQKNLIGLLYYDPLANVWYFVRPNTLLLSVSLYSVPFSCTLQIYKLKFKSEYYLWTKS